MSVPAFSLQNIWSVLGRRWKTWCLLFPLCGLIAATAGLLVFPRYYGVQAIATPANSTLADKNYLFGKEIRELYSYFGSGNDLDRLYSLAATDTIGLALIQHFHLVSYYYPQSDSSDPEIQLKTLRHLQQHLEIEKTTEDQLKFTAWFHSRQLAADIVNYWVTLVQQNAVMVWKNRYSQTRQLLDSNIAATGMACQQLRDSMHQAGGMPPGAGVLQQLADKQNRLVEYQAIADQLKSLEQSPPPALYVLEPGIPLTAHVYPSMFWTLASAFLIALVIGTCWVMVAERRNP